jgi:hypothetical protein
MRMRLRMTIILGVALLLSLGIAGMGAPRQTASKTSKTEKTVYVCACMGTKSCPCMAMSKKEGKCPCGSDEMKAVPSNSAWANANRKALK